MNNSAAAWADAYKLHQAAVECMGRKEPADFWNWYHEEAYKIANKHANGPLILALLMAVFDDTSQRYDMLSNGYVVSA